MNNELDKQLCEKYPLIFKDRNEDMRKTAMCWGFEHGDGWYNLIDNLCLCIQHHTDTNNNSRKRLLISNDYNQKIPDEVEQPVAMQVKEKYGTLRFYYFGGDDVIDGMVQLAETMSGTICEVCGSPGESTNGGWMRTLCEEHKK